MPPAAVNAAVVNAFRQADRTLDLSGRQYVFDGETGEGIEPPPTVFNAGGLRRTKFHVLCSSAHLEDSYAYMEDDFPHTWFTYGLTLSVGTSGPVPCDTNGDGMAAMNEIVSWFAGFRDPYQQGFQRIQAYPEGSDYALFLRQ